jgi:hypothetical protein
MGFFAAFGVLVSVLPGCSSLNSLLRALYGNKTVWKIKAKEFWTARVKQREIQRATERREGKRPNIKTPFPFLECQASESSRGSLAAQFRQIPLNQWSDVYFNVKNRGNGAAYSCYVEMYETPFAKYHMKYSDMRLVSRIVTTVMPGQKKEVTMRWQSTRQTNGGMVARCYDPILDPGASTYEQYYRQSDGFSWSQWIGG